jgi:hypothetical protein
MFPNGSCEERPTCPFEDSTGIVKDVLFELNVVVQLEKRRMLEPEEPIIETIVPSGLTLKDPVATFVGMLNKVVAFSP